MMEKKYQHMMEQVNMDEGFASGLLEQIQAQETPQSPAPSPEPEALAGFPAWQRDGLAALQAAGVIDSPDYWAAKFSEGVTVGELFGILGKMAGRA